MASALPIYEIEHELITRLRDQSRLILSAPTGSGKSTQVPQMLLKHGLLEQGQVVVLQPRRLPARLLAARVAEELDVSLGREVGYQIRFENQTSAATNIRFVTEGILLRQMLADPQLKGVSVILFDEFHERHLYGDITLARALDLQETTRPDLRIVVMSATLNAELLVSYLSQWRNGKGNGCSRLISEGRMYPVDIRYSTRPSYTNKTPIWEQAVEAFEDFTNSGGEGDTLIFMPGGFEITQTIEALRRSPAARGHILLPLHGELPPREQDAAVAKHRQPKVVVATNVAETSLTIDGIRLVIDSGLARIPKYDPHRGINTLLIERISRASSDQRAGRAGRTAPGRCVRLWTEEEHAHRPLQELPEIKRLDLAEVILTLKAADVEDLSAFRWLEAPDKAALEHAEELLLDLGALEPTDKSEQTQPAHTRITTLGRRMLAFPMHPRYARLLLAAQDYGCVPEAALIAALTQGRDLLLRNAERQVADAREDLLGTSAPSDFLLLMRAWKQASQQDFRPEVCRKFGLHVATARQVGPLRDNFLRIAEREGLNTQTKAAKDDVLQKCLLVAFSDRVGRRLDTTSRRCELVHGRRGELARESVVQNSPLIVAAEVSEVGSQGGNISTILSMITAVQPEWLQELFPQDITSKLHVFFDSNTKRVVADELLQFRGLALEKRRVEPPPTDEAARILASEVMAGRVQFDEWDESVEQWILRLKRLSEWCPEFELPVITEADRKDLIEQLCYGCFGYKDIRAVAVKSEVKGWLSPLQNSLLDKHAPERLEFANGRKPKVVYVADGPPYIEARIQELYDVPQTPKIAMGRVPVSCHILAPSRRPVQVTQDLPRFWQEHYPRIKAELQRRYPRHEWR
jgi:ATP-dependent helicase HrpB